MFIDTLLAPMVSTESGASPSSESPHHGVASEATSAPQRSVILPNSLDEATLPTNESIEGAVDEWKRPLVTASERSISLAAPTVNVSATDRVKSQMGGGLLAITCDRFRIGFPIESLGSVVERPPDFCVE